MKRRIRPRAWAAAWPSGSAPPSTSSSHSRNSSARRADAGDVLTGSTVSADLPGRGWPAPAPAGPVDPCRSWSSRMGRVNGHHQRLVVTNRDHRPEGGSPCPSDRRNPQGPPAPAGPGICTPPPSWKLMVAIAGDAELGTPAACPDSPPLPSGTSRRSARVVGPSLAGGDGQGHARKARVKVLKGAGLGIGGSDGLSAGRPAAFTSPVAHARRLHAAVAAEQPTGDLRAAGDRRRGAPDHHHRHRRHHRQPHRCHSLLPLP